MWTINNIHFLQECINFHFIIGDKVCHFTTLHQSSNQSHDDFDSSIKNLELNLDKVLNFKPLLVVALYDFNTKSMDWCSNDIANFEGVKMDLLT